MKCEICHENPAETAIGTDGDGEELYVCKACAEKEQQRRRKRRERTRKAQEAGVQGSQQGDDDAPPFLNALVDAMNDVVSGLEKVVQQHERDMDAEKEAEERKFVPLRNMRVAAPYMICGRLHLEGLSLIGEIDAVYRAVEALGLRLEGISSNGLVDVGHIYSVCHSGDETRARRVVNAIVEQEKNARIRLFEELPRVFGDSLCRALAILKNCRLLSECECFDLLSPLRLAAMEDMLDGIKTREIERMMKSLHLDPPEVPMSLEEHQADDAARADAVNRRFEDVVIDE